jgi:hypothetical protein
MRPRTVNRQLVFTLGLAGWGFLMLLVAAALLALFLSRRALIYPEARIVSDHSTYGLLPRPYLRQDLSLRSADLFPAVYNWYSTELDLGPEARAQSRCIFLEAAGAWFVVKRYTSVTVCDTASGRMMFVQRSLWIR